MSIIALDWGQRFVGYASADPEGLVITPRGHFERKATKENTWKLSAADIEQLEDIFESWETDIVVLGLPLNADGKSSAASENAKLLARHIEKELKLTVFLVDERLTSWEAKGKDNHGEAAALILKNYFSNNRLSHESEGE
jgi:putative Holliday junction resolvase